jgi:energy-coupling factor transporter ATP-binding protein EcfA2
MSKEAQRSKAHAVMERLGISHLANQNARTLSAGERQRVCIASLLALDPQWVLFDEPFANIDAKNRHLIKQLIVDLSEKGKGIVLTSHYISETDMPIHHTHHLHDGRLKERNKSS